MRAKWAAVIILVLIGGAGAQEQTTSPEELNRKYQDALTQLQAAQGRKNELAGENEKLSARVAALEKQLDESNRLTATFAEQTFQLRSHYAAWNAFIRRYPLLMERWKVFIQSEPLDLPADMPELTDPRNPLSLR